MKKYISSLIIVIICNSSFAQNNITKKADKLFDKFEYLKAAEQYSELIANGNKDTFVLERLANSYYNLFEPERAVAIYASFIDSEYKNSENVYRYAEMLKVLDKIQEYREQMNKFVLLAPNDIRSELYLENPNFMEVLESGAEYYKIDELQTGSSNSEFGFVLHNGTQVYFTSARNDSGKTYARTEEPFLDLFTAQFTGDIELSNVEAIDELNSNWHDGPATLSEDGNTIYFSTESFRNNIFEKDSARRLKFSQIAIYKAVKLNGIWSNIEPLPFNSESYSVSNPSISKDEKILYFSSNMPGSFGGNDIWKVELKDNNTYGEPINLGRNVNTEGNESFPYISDQNILYFSSDGRPGFGGLDIFKIDLERLETAQNLAKPINSEKNDFSFSISNEDHVGFLTSNRDGSNKSYIVTPLHIEFEQLAQIIDAETNSGVENAKLELVSLNDSLSYTSFTGPNGEIKFNLKSEEEYKLVVTKTGYLEKEILVSGKREELSDLVISLNPNQEVDSLMAEDDSNGFDQDFNESETVSYQNQLGAVDEFGPSDNVDYADSLEEENEFLNETNDSIEQTEICDSEINEIYFGFDQSTITEEAKIELDLIIELMQECPNLKVLITAHTDNRGSDAYNMALSERRSMAAVNYLTDNGAEGSRIIAEALGESNPIVDCYDFCSEFDHAKNRVATFEIIRQNT